MVAYPTYENSVLSEVVLFRHHRRIDSIITLEQDSLFDKLNECDVFPAYDSAGKRLTKVQTVKSRLDLFNFCKIEEDFIKFDIE